MTRRLLMTADAVGGVWQYAIELAAALRPLGWDTTIALLGPAPSPAQRALAGDTPLIDTGLPLDWLGSDAVAVRAAGRAVNELAARIAADLLHLNQPALAACPAPAMPRLVAMHSCVATWWAALDPRPAPAAFGWQSLLVGEGLRVADAVVCPSHAFAREVTAAYALATPPAVVHNGRTPLGGAPGALHDFALTCGRLWDRGKDIATLDRAAALLGVPFKAAGAVHGPNGERVVLDHLHALGSVDQPTLAALLAARPVFVSAACYEPFGLAVLEAALAGCPLVLADIPTHRELWDGVATFVAAGDARAFAAAIQALIGDAATRLARGDLARRRAANFTPARMATAMADRYRALLPAAAAQVAA